jgi:hypothetical protein
MKTKSVNVFPELLTNCIEESIQRGDLMLTQQIVREPVFMLRTEESPVLFTFGWDSQEKYSVLSLN